jgi:hypothetical protein
MSDGIVFSVFRNRILGRGSYSLHNYFAISPLLLCGQLHIHLWIDPRENCRDGIGNLIARVYDRYTTEIQGDLFGHGTLDPDLFYFHRISIHPAVVPFIVQNEFTLSNGYCLNDFLLAEVLVDSPRVDWGSVRSIVSGGGALH